MGIKLIRNLDLQLRPCCMCDLKKINNRVIDVMDLMQGCSYAPHGISITLKVKAKIGSLMSSDRD